MSRRGVGVSVQRMQIACQETWRLGHVRSCGPSEVYALGRDWGPPNFFVEDADGVLVEFVSM